MRRLLLSLPLLAVLAMPASAATGSYTYSPSESDNVDKAIEAAIAPMNIVVRTVARGRLAKVNQPYHHVSLTTGPKISVATDGRAPITAASGSTIKWTRPDDGEKLEVTLAMVGTSVKETFASPDGKRVNTFTPSADGKKLVMSVVVSSSKLPKPLSYKLTYKKD